MRYIVIPIAIILYCIWSYQSIKELTKIRPDTESLSVYAIWYCVLHILLVFLGICALLALIGGFVIDNW